MSVAVTRSISTRHGYGALNNDACKLMVVFSEGRRRLLHDTQIENDLILEKNYFVLCLTEDIAENTSL
ncbi:hypothetical protein Trydic_g8448, partial [Trypoxylus dichotomus]